VTTSKRIGRQKHVKALENAHRRRMMVLEHRERARKVASEVSEGVSETVALREGRGGAFVHPKRRTGEMEKPIRAMSGLEYLATRKPPWISEEMKRKGELYGACWRAATGEPSLRSCINDQVTGSAVDPLWGALTAAERRIHASEKLAEMNLILWDQESMIAAMIEVCGRELTPREATRNGQEANILLCLVTVALDQLVESGRARIGSRA
jgi:hypothetical protein